MNQIARGSLVLALVCLMAIRKAPAQGSAATDRDTTAARIAQGRAVFEGKGLCFSCHGKNGEGVLGPSTRLVGRKLVHAKPELEQVAALIKSGVDSATSTIGQAMPPKGGARLSDAEINAVAAYVLELQRKEKP